MADMYNTSDNTTKLSCQTIAESCNVLDEIIYPEFQDTLYADDTTWILTSAFIIFTMQSGFAMIEIGVSSPGNEVNVLLKNVCDLLFGTAAFYLLGYGLAFGEPSNSFMGLGSFAPSTDFNDQISNALFYGQYIFQLSFACTSTTIVSGATAMRIRFSVYCLYAFYAVVVYAFVAHWVWAPGGWLMNMGVHDFAGGGPVHLLGGMNSFVGVIFLGPRKGRFDKNRREADYSESSPTNQLLGLLVLWFAWIGFNCGSSFGITEDKWLVATRTAVSTMNASMGGGLMGILYSQWSTNGKFVRAYDLMNGILGGLISSSPTSACTQPWEAIIIGAVGSLIACWTNEKLFKEKMQIDDPVGAVGTHAGAGIWGVFAVGLFANSRYLGIEVADGLFHGGGFRQLGIQCVEIVAIIAWSIATATLFFYVVGVALSRDLRNPGAGVRLEFPDEPDFPHKADPKIHGCMEDNIDMKGVLENVRDEYYEQICREVLSTMKRGSSYREIFPNSRSIAPRANPVRPVISLGTGTFSPDRPWRNRTVTLDMDDAKWEDQPEPTRAHSWRNRKVSFNLDDSDKEDELDASPGQSWASIVRDIIPPSTQSQND